MYKPFHKGQFHFDELLQHLESYNASKIVSIGEDTRVISRIDYDSQTNRLVGFVLPWDSAGLPFAIASLLILFSLLRIYFKQVM